jgi:hypothetical protein
MSQGSKALLVAVGVAVALASAPVARADNLNLDISGQIYMKYMYQNNNTQGCLSMSNPFWVDNIGGSNGVCSEASLIFNAKIGPKVSAGLIIQSRWGALWQDWWENGDLKPGIQDTSGASLGMDHAQYMKLRSAWIRFAPPIPTVNWITVGSSDFSMWNAWTIGKSRYIDRYNGGGAFVEGKIVPNDLLTYTVGAMGLPKLWAGPGWQTGLKDSDPLAYLWGTDWAFALKLGSRPFRDLRLTLVGALIKDWEADKYSPMLTGPPSADRGANMSIGLVTRFTGYNGTLEAVYTPSSLEWLSVNGMLAGSSNYVNPAYATNLVRNGQGFSPVVFKTDSNLTPVAAQALAGTLTVSAFDPFDIGLSFQAQYFNIGSDYNAIMGARREADVLLTDGIITGGFTRGGQLPTLNIANEFQDWDEPWYESCIGWNGITGLLEYTSGPIKTSLEYTYIGYNTNMQNRDVKNQYPDFLYTNGFTDTTAFTSQADYANVYDRGKDPRSVYAQYQERSTHIGVLNFQSLLSFLPGGVVNAKLKYVQDQDKRNLDDPNSLYLGKEYLGFLSLTLQPLPELKTTVGYEYTYWNETGREGTYQSGFTPAYTYRQTAQAGLAYAFGGVLFSYTLQYFWKNLDRTPPAYYNMHWNVWRSKATIEVAF